MTKPWLLWVWVYFQSPRVDGLSASEEAPKLFEIEDALAAAVARSCGGILSGVITTEGRREFYFYAETPEPFESVISEVLRPFVRYKYDLDSQVDPVWNQYFNVLYPSEEQLERIANRDLLNYLVEQGDNPTIEREVLHWIYFPSEKSRSAFKESALKVGFQVDSEYVEDDGTFCICLMRAQSLLQPQLDDIVIELFRLAKRLEGEYTGWETPVMQ